MKIKFLGTSFGAPSKDRFQQSCLVEENENLYIFDTGAPVLEVLIREGYKLSKVKAIFISHMHADHLSGIFSMLSLAGFFRMNFTIYMAEQRGIDLLKKYCEQLTGVLQSGIVQFKLYEEGDVYKDENINVTSFKTGHTSASFGFMIEGSDNKLFITGDLTPSLNDVPEILYSEQTDLIVTECAHFSPEELFDKLKICNSRAFAVIHVMPSDKYSQLKIVADNLPLKVYFPNDNDEIDLKCLSE